MSWRWRSTPAPPHSFTTASARWEAIAELKRAVRVPVLGNGDIWEAEDALRMMRQTGCDGVVVGRGCLGRPWLFRDLADVFAGREPADPPSLGAVAAIMREHAELLTGWFGEGPALRSFRRHASWYTKGFRGSAALRQRFMQVSTLRELDETLAAMDPERAVSSVGHARSPRQGERHAVGEPTARLPRRPRRHDAARRGSRRRTIRRLTNEAPVTFERACQLPATTSFLDRAFAS